MSFSATHGLYGNGIFVAFDQDICMLEFRAISQKSANNVTCFQSGLDGVQFLAVDVAGQVIFYYNSTRKEIKSYELLTSTVKTVLQTNTGDVSGNYNDCFHISPVRE